MLRKILIVDSDEQVTAVLELKLKKENYDVRTLSGSVNALKTLKEFKPHLIISEMVLPELSGVDFLKRVKMNPETKNIPFIFLSSSRVVEDKILAHEMGAEAFFMKPVLIKVLINRINDFFEQAKFNELLDLSKGSKDFKGDLSSISVIDVLNIIAENSSSGVVLFTSSTGDEAKVFFSNGSVLRVETKDGDNKNGTDELFRLLSWLDGNFVINYKDVSVQRNVRIPHDRLVVKAADWLDDYTSELSEMPPLDSKLYVDFGQFMNTINKFPDKVSGIIRAIGPDGGKLSEVIEKTDLDRRLTVEYLKQLIGLEVISSRKKESPYTLPPEPRWLTKACEKMEVLDIPEKKDDVQFSKTIVPPPDLARRDTIDPAIGIVIDASIAPVSIVNMNELAHEDEVAEQAVADKEAEISDIEIEEPQFDDLSGQKTEIVQSVHNDEELKSIIEDHLQDVKLESEARKTDPEYLEKTGSFRAGMMVYLILLVLAFALFMVYYGQKKEDIEKILNMDLSEPFSGKKADVPEIKVIDESLQDLTLAELIDRAAGRYEEQKYEDALNINRFALEKLKNDKIDSGENYEKVITNMAIYLYMTGRFEEAVKYAEESTVLRETAKSIELKAAVLEELGRNIEAASFLRSKLNDERFAGKREEWVVEINRLEKIKR